MKNKTTISTEHKGDILGIYFKNSGVVILPSDGASLYVTASSVYRSITTFKEECSNHRNDDRVTFLYKGDTISIDITL